MTWSSDCRMSVLVSFTQMRGTRRTAACMALFRACNTAVVHVRSCGWSLSLPPR